MDPFAFLCAQAAAQAIGGVVALITRQSELDMLREVMQEKTGRYEALVMQMAAMTEASAEERRAFERRMEEVQREHADDAQRREKAMQALAEKFKERTQTIREEQERVQEQCHQEISEMRVTCEKKIARSTAGEIESRIAISLRHLTPAHRRLASSMDAYKQVLKSVAAIQGEIFVEEARLSRFMDIRHERDVLRLVLWGVTGAGKSSLACRLAGAVKIDCSDGPFKVSHSVVAETQEIKSVVIDPRSRKVSHLGYCHRVMLVDQPGALDTEGVDVQAQHANSMIAYLSGIEFVHAFGFVISFKQPRLRSSEKQLLVQLTRQLGITVWQNVILLVTNVRAAEDFAATAEGRECRDAHDIDVKKWVKQIKKKIRKILRLDERSAPLPHVAMDNKFRTDYTRKSTQIINDVLPVIGRKPFTCDELRSPLDEKKGRLVSLQDELAQAKERVRNESESVNTIIAEVHGSCRRLVELSTSDEGAPTRTLEELLLEYCLKHGVDFTQAYEVNFTDLLGMVDGEVQAAGDLLMMSSTELAVDDDAKEESEDSDSDFLMSAIEGFPSATPTSRKVTLCESKARDSYCKADVSSAMLVSAAAMDSHSLDAFGSRAPAVEVSAADYDMRMLEPEYEPGAFVSAASTTSVDEVDMDVILAGMTEEERLEYVMSVLSVQDQ